MTTSTAETVPAAASSVRTDKGIETPTTRTRRGGSGTGEKEGGVARYFLAKVNGNGNTPVLDREVASEGEALVEALRLGVTYYAIHEFRVIPDFAGRRPQLKKEIVRGK